MVKAILDGRKTMTRRIMKPQPIKTDIACIDRMLNPTSGDPNTFRTWLKNSDGGIDVDYNAEYWKCPYGKIGNELWVRETFGYFGDKVIYRAGPHENDKVGYYGLDGWKPSIFMPKKVSRITLKTTDIKVERVQDISEKDVKTEGYPFGFPEDIADCHTNTELFIGFWDSINEKRGFGWDKNPWVWCISFERVK